MNVPEADRYGTETVDKLYYASDRLLKDDGLVTFTKDMCHASSRICTS